jgi:hypothetical protein
MSNKEELANVVNELIQRVVGVAEVADKVWVGDNVGPDIRNCADVIKQHLDQIVMEKEKEDAKEENLRELAIKNCSNTFKHLETFDPKTLRSTDIKMFEILTTHSRELFELIQCGEDVLTILENEDEKENEKEDEIDVL